MIAGCIASIRGLKCDGEGTGPTNSDPQKQLRDFKCEAKYYVARSIKSLIGTSDGNGNDWWFTATTGPLGCE